MKKTILCVCMILTAMVFCAAAFAGETDYRTMKNGEKMLIVGDSVAKVINVLGRPYYRESKLIERRYRDGSQWEKVEYWYFKVENDTYRITIYRGRVYMITRIWG